MSPSGRLEREKRREPGAPATEIGEHSRVLRAGSRFVPDSFPLRVVVLLGCCVPLTGCLGSFLVEQLDLSRDRRQGMDLVAEDASFSVHASAGISAPGEGRVTLEFLEAVLEHYASLFGQRPSRRVNVFIHSPESYGDPPITSTGRAWCDDFSFDVKWPDHYLLAHELGHLVACDRLGGNARPFLDEGMAEYLASSFTRPYSARDRVWIRS